MSSNKQNLLALLFVPEGKIDRMQFFLMNLWLLVLGILLMFLAGGGIMFSANKGGMASSTVMAGGIMGLVMLVFSLLMFYISVVITIKRLRDAGLSPWFVVLYFVPFVNLLLFIYLLIAPSKES